jgi:hypothetical protein
MDVFNKIDDIKRMLEDKFKSLRIAANQIEITHGLSDISKRLGIFQSGELRFGNSVEPGKGFTGLRIGYPFFTYDSTLWIMAAVSNDVIQFGIKSDGTMGFKTVYKDQFVDGMSLKGGAADPPTFALFAGGIWSSKFVDAATNASHGTIELQHDYKDGTDLEVHLHWSPTTTHTGNCRWGFEYCKSNMNAVFSATTEVVAHQAGSGSVGMHQYLTLATISGVGLTKGAVIVFRVYRGGANATDTFVGDAFLHRVAVHYAVDKIGSVT